ncbi:hypothetical protein B0I31_112179 [Saccharothrix carnea]|uniref:Uncharacterized protein n=1 Tax=Saccharothrix carnea TaxID=1280637 RepID=A0A2P8I2L4_SACCR|nr:hypothetical protein [Saccharothrix carnea]PSL52710.1 hypothetical protein B0I31_112179 [Saccharothrix carnea]
MNEVSALREHGPEPTPLSDDVLAKARADLLAEILARPAAVEPVRLRRRTALIAAAAAVVVVAGIVATDSTDTPTPPSTTEEPPVLVRFDMPTLPPVLDPIPAGVTEPGFTAEPGWFAAVYGDADRRPGRAPTGITVMTHQGRPSADGGRDTTYSGKPAVVGRVDQEEPAYHSVSLTWERSPGRWITLTGRGDYADEQAVRSLADTLVDTEERLSLDISVAPAGWELFAFKDAGPDGDGAVTSLRDPRAPARVIHVSTMLSLVPNYGEVLEDGSRPVDPVSVNGRRGDLVHLADGRWMLQAPLPDGRAFQLQVPAGFTREQVVELAESVS